MAAARRQQTPGWIVRCPAGLARLTGRELRFRKVLRADSRIVQRRQRGHDLLFLPRGAAARPPDCSLRIPEAIFECIAFGRYKASNAQLDAIAAAVRAKSRPHRLLVAVDGSHFRRQDLTRWLAQRLDQLGAPPAEEAADTLAMFCVDEAYYVGLQRCSFKDAPHRERRTRERGGALPVTIAAAMSFAGRPRTRAMPPSEGVGFHDGEHGPPVDQPGEQDQRNPGRVVGSMRPDATFSVQRQLLPQEEILRRQLRPGGDAQ